MIYITKKLNLQDNTGTKKFFIPLFEYNQYSFDERRRETHLDPIPTGLLEMEGVDRDAFQKQIGIVEMEQFYQAVTAGEDSFEFQEFIELVNQNTSPWVSVESYVQYRLGSLVIPAQPINYELYGLWVMFETNWGDAKRGYRIRKDTDFPVQEKMQYLEANPEFRPPVPYIAKSESVFHRAPDGTPAKAEVKFEVDNFLNITLDISWIDPQVIHPLKSDLIVDLGNTRTVALLMDTPEKANNNYGRLSAFRSYCRPLLLKPKENVITADNKSLENAIIDTWFLLCKQEYDVPCFEEWEVKTEKVRKVFGSKNVLKLKTIYKCVPHLFTKISPILCGMEASDMYNDPLAKKLSEMNLPFEQSSPKRYYWQNDSIDMHWCMCSRTYDENYQQTLDNVEAAPPNAYGPVFAFMPVSGEILDPEVDLTENSTAMDRTGYPIYPRASTLTWFLLNILEKAWEQLNDTFSAAQGVRPKYIANVIGTYPSGWTQPEIDMYKERWQEAINIFHRTHFPKDEFPIALDLSVDEAVAGQIPFLVGEVTKANRNLTNWLKIAGAKDENGEYRTRIMNIDIGGGTTDISVIEHSKHPNSAPGMSSIDCRLLSKEGFNIAGDSIVKGIVEQIILPALDGDRIANMSTNIDQQQTQKRVRAVRGCLIPLANEILKKTILGEKNPSISPADCCDGKNWEILTGLIGSGFDYTNQFNFSPEQVFRIVDSLFDDLIARCAVYAYAYDVDFVFLSGKPSELPVIRELVEKHFGLPLDRIIVAKNYLVGDWYPFGNGQYIGDAKSVTAVGCAIKHALNTGRIEGWQIFNVMNESGRNQWSILVPPADDGGRAFVPEDGEVLSFEADEMDDLKLFRAGSHLARRQNELFNFEPVYKLVSHNKDVEELKVRFGRSSVGGGEGLESLEATTVDGQTLEVGKDVSLRIWPCAADTYEFWQESGKFDNIPE